MTPSDSAPVAQPKRCFVITPLGESNSEVRRNANGIIDAVIKPVTLELGFDLFLPHTMSESGSITNQIIDHLLNDELVIANMTGLNPNVMYELAVRHAVRLPVVTIMSEDTRLPFDIIGERAVPYRNDMAGAVELREPLTKAIHAALGSPDPDNPIYRVARDNVMKEILKGSPDAYILERLDRLQTLIEAAVPYTLESVFLTAANRYKGRPPRNPPSVDPILTATLEGEKATIDKFAVSLGPESVLSPLMMVNPEGTKAVFRYLSSSRQEVLQAFADSKTDGLVLHLPEPT